MLPHPRRRPRRVIAVAAAVALLAAPTVARSDEPDPTGPSDPEQVMPADVEVLHDPGYVQPDPPPVVVPVPERVFTQESWEQARPDAPGTTDTTTPRPIDAPRQRISGFAESTREPVPIPEGSQPYQTGRVRPVPFGLVDTEGVRVFRADWDRKIYDHPIAQAQYALAALESYRLSGEQQYLDVAIANADRIIERRHVIDGAWYFPYDFDFDLFRNGRGVLTAPWASGMSSGQALSTFVRLYELTGDRRWWDAADQTFAAFLQAPDGRGYFSSFVDTSGQLWLEEYSRYPVMDSERVLNGHMWSMFGVWDYWMMYDYEHADAEQIFRGSLATLERSAMTGYRNPGTVSYDSLWHRVGAHTYHMYHQQQFLMLYRMTHDTLWAARASTLRADWPEYRSAGSAVLTPRTRTAYRLDDTAVHIKDRTMQILESKPVTITSVTGAPYDRRGEIANGPNVIRLSDGWLKGWWVEEGFGQAWARELVEYQAYLPDAHLYVTEDIRVSVYRYDAAGNETGSRLVTLEAGTTYPTDRSAYTQGRPSFQITEGELDGWWLPEQPQVLLRRTTG